MAEKNSKREVKCWGCQRTLEAGDTKLGMCSKCLNAYGSPVAAAAAIGLTFGGKYLVKNGGKIVKGVMNVAKNFRI